MVVDVQRATPATYANLAERVRFKAGDGLATKFTSAAIYREMRDMLSRIYNAMGVTPSWTLQSYDLPYTGGADSTLLDTDNFSSPIDHVIDISNTSAPVILKEVSPSQIESYRATTTVSPTLAVRSVYAIMGSSIALRPVPAGGKTLRIWIVGNFLFNETSDPTVDQHPYPVNHEELIVLGTAMKLMSIDGSATDDQRMELADLWETFHRDIGSQQGPRDVQNVRTRRTFGRNRL